MRDKAVPQRQLDSLPNGTNWRIVFVDGAGTPRTRIALVVLAFSVSQKNRHEI